jgi:hypothetical protein
LFKFLETGLWSVFEENYLNNIDYIQYFKESLLRKKDKYYLPYISPSIVQIITEIQHYSIIKSKRYHYDYFPNLNPELFIKIDTPKVSTYQSKFQISNGEVIC